MFRARTAVLAAVLASALVAPAAASANPALEMLQRVNEVRAHNGVPPLHFSRSLAHSAHAYSAHMMSSGYFGHSSRIHASRRFRTLGEIIEFHRGRRAAVGMTLNDWMNSSEHRSIILSGAFDYAGAGFVKGRFQGHSATIWVMHFGHH